MEAAVGKYSGKAVRRVRGRTVNKTAARTMPAGNRFHIFEFKKVKECFIEVLALLDACCL